MLQEKEYTAAYIHNCIGGHHYPGESLAGEGGTAFLPEPGARRLFWLYLSATSNNPPLFRSQFLHLMEQVDRPLAEALEQIPLPDYTPENPVWIIRRELKRRPFAVPTILVLQNWGILLDGAVKEFLLALEKAEIPSFQVVIADRG